MPVKLKTQSERMLSELEKEYSNVKKAIQGKPYKSPLNKAVDPTNVEIDSLELKLAIEKLSVVLNEAKSLAKQ
jgi:hypothetical protein